MESSEVTAGVSSLELLGTKFCSSIGILKLRTLKFALFGILASGIPWMTAYANASPLATNPAAVAAFGNAPRTADPSSVTSTGLSSTFRVPSPLLPATGE